MDLKKIASELSEIERKVLNVLSDEKEYGLQDLEKGSSLNIDSVRRAVGWLQEKKLIELKEEKQEKIVLTKNGEEIKEKGFPERIMLLTLQKLGGRATVKQLLELSGLNAQEFNAAFGMNKKFNYMINSNVLSPNGEQQFELSEIGEEALKEGLPQEKQLNAIAAGENIEEELVRELFRRRLIEKQEIVKRRAKINENGLQVLSLLKEVKERSYVLEGSVKPLYIGKKQPYVQFLQHIRRKLVELGFQEMPERIITQEFYNFDVLFQPQNHPARSWSDTYQLKKPTHGKLLHKKAVERVKAAHEHGWKTGSIGWGYKWSKEIASKIMPTAHGTTADARKLCEGVDEGKYFVINRCYRPDVLDATHLVEFNQLDGFVVGTNLNFKHLLGILKSFAKEIAGAEKVKFLPDYYPFTEPSVQLSAKHPELGWIEFAGSGIFRPEVTQPLGIKEPVIAWGMGVDRLAMFKLGIKDIRYLFSQDLNWLRKSRMVLEE